MATWGEQASEVVKQDVTSLVNVALDITSSTLQGGVASRQFAVLMDLEGSLRGQLAFGDGAVDVLVQTAIENEASLRAVLIVPDCGDEAQPVLRGYGDHREGPPFECTFAWRRQTDSTELALDNWQFVPSSWWLFD